tara:strand:- start:18779 stop:20803 length:2025 start_codon:yes stop_codon:yes gene_type:complete
MKTIIQRILVVSFFVGISIAGKSQDLSCLKFDGMNDFLIAKNLALNEIKSGDFTFEAWVNGEEALQSAHPTIFSNRTSITRGTVFFFHSRWGGSLWKMLTVQLHGVNYYVFNNGTLNGSMLDGSCHHVAITRSGSLLTFYFDGVAIGIRNITNGNPSVASLSPFYIGQDKITLNAFEGNLSQIRIWNHARTQSQILNDKNISLTPPLSGLLGYWEMNDGTGQVVIDKTGLADAQRGYSATTDPYDPSWGATCCMEPITPPTNEGAYCCEGENLVKNGNFEAGDNDFGSDYTQDGSTDPGEYDVATSASNFGTTVKDHSNCVNPVDYPNNKKYLVVNGKTQQTGKSVIWEQTINVEDWKGYKFCFQAKNLDQCTFNIAPVLDIEFSMPVGNMTQTISAPVGPCGWQEISKGIDLWGYGTSLTIKILLDESGNGDGNDLAIDDISLIQLEQCPASTALFDITTITVPQQNYYSVSATAQIVAPCESVWWGVCEYDWGASNCISGTELNGQWWTTTTDFTGYDGTSTNNNSGSPGQFEYGKLYRITRGSWGECDSWNQSSKFVAAFGKEEIMVYSEEEFNALDKTDLKQKLGVINQSEDEMKIYPNPAKHQFTISILNETISSIEILSVSGQKVFTKQLERGNNEETIDISSLASGMYFVRVTGVNQKQYTANVIKE